MEEGSEEMDEGDVLMKLMEECSRRLTVPKDTELISIKWGSECGLHFRQTAVSLE